MSTSCSPSDCENCTADCSSRGGSEATDFKAVLGKGSSVKHVIAVMSGKGGVGKSLVTSLLAVAFAKRGYRTAILDGDITGPSIPKAFNVGGTLYLNDDDLIIPAISDSGVEIISANLMLNNETDPILWRGALIAGAVKQFYEETYWENIDYMFVDMPPGTGDVPLTVFQSLPVEGIIMVTTPQDLVSMIVAKAVNMAKKMNVPLYGIVENMSYFCCPDNGKQYDIFGKSKIQEVAESHGLAVLARLPINPEVAGAVDSGRIESLDTSAIEPAVELILALDKINVRPEK